MHGLGNFKLPTQLMCFCKFTIFSPVIKAGGKKSLLHIPLNLQSLKQMKYFSIQCTRSVGSALLLEGFQSSPVCPSGKSSKWIRASVEHWCNDPDRTKSKYSDKSLSHCHFVHHKFHTDWASIEPAPPR